MASRVLAVSPLGWLWIGIVLHLFGDLVDLRWHSAHDVETAFESYGNQLEAHWLLWIGAAVTMVVAFLALRTGAGNRGYGLVLAMALLYAAGSVWHGWEHAHARDPALPHVLLAISKVGMVAGAVWARAVNPLARRRRAGRRRLGAGARISLDAR